jgi:hypothetical protein
LQSLFKNLVGTCFNRCVSKLIARHLSLSCPLQYPC